MSEPRTLPCFNHIAMAVPKGVVSPRGRDELLAFYGDVFGWTEMPTMSEDDVRLVFRCHSNEQFVFLEASDRPMRCNELDHFGVGVSSVDQFEGMLERARKHAERDRTIELTNHLVDDYKVLGLHHFYVRYRLPMKVEVQCFDWAEGFDAQRMS